MDSETWTVKRILGWIEGYLRDKGDENPRLSAQWLVSDALGVGRIELFMDLERPLSEEERAILRDYTRRRGAGEPLQYITGTTDFRFITVEVEHGVLIPRPETEVLVSEALTRLDAARNVKRARLAAAQEAMIKDMVMHMDVARDDGEDKESFPIQDNVIYGEDRDTFNNPSHAEVGEDTRSQALQDETPTMLVADLCTGSGCIACSIATEVPYAQVVATDIDPKAVSLARRNSENLGVEDRVTILECDLGSGIERDMMGSFDLVISNPPYIPTDVLATLDAQVAEYESALALDGGEDGFDVFRRILPFAIDALAPGGVLAVELHETCLDEAVRMTENAGFEDVCAVRDLAGRPRVLVARKG